MIEILPLRNISCCLVLVLTIFHFVFCNHVFAQSGLWTFMHGDSSIGNSPVFGTLGVTDPANKPPAVYEPCEWIDHDGNFWMLGGDSYNCLWKYDPLMNQWTWMNGSNTTGQTGSYGVQGIFSPANHPGGRQAATSWVDNDGLLWLFGGYGYGAAGFQSGLNDLWKYDISLNQWAWMDGSTLGGGLGVYGTQGVPDTANIPGGRLESAAAWVDADNNLWLFGGQLCCAASGFINDLWKYSTSTGEWTWMKGSNISYALGIYGTKGVPDVANTPGSRRIYSHWKDDSNNFWIFGGQDNNQNVFNDLWRYDPVTNNWTWMKGSNSVNSTGNFGTQCILDSINDPPARMENRFYWTDSCYNFWMFGGLNTINGKYHNDLWCYTPSLDQWKWVSGSMGGNQDGNYGIVGIPGAGNRPGARYGGVAWVGQGESFWLYGGVGYSFDINNVGSLNDLWRFVPDSACVSCSILNLPSSALQSTDTFVCEKFCVDYFDQSSNSPSAWLWEFEGGIPSTSIDQNPTNICYDVPGQYDVTLITTNAYGSDTLILPDFITVFPTPAFPTITQNGNVLTSSSASQYQWQFNSIDIAGATNQSYTVTETGYYTVVISDTNGCISSSTLYIEITGVNEINLSGISIYPNPSTGNFIIEWPQSYNSIAGISVINTLGQTVYTANEIKIPINHRSEINLAEIAYGIYFIEIKTKEGFTKRKIIISD